ncbi:MAG: tetratricopeptide repeat protein, partial [Prolixibacteraceae bacterium]|nr:tetratricopeptide repeat protein [Prolixibacteraceae bacterium]
EGISSVLTNISAVYNSMANYPKSMEYAFEGLRLFEKNGNKYGQANCLTNIANLYLVQSDNETALKYFEKALPMYKEVKSSEGIALVEGNIGSIFIEEGKLARAMEACEKSLALYSELQIPDGVERNTGNIGSIYLKQKEYKKALEKFFDALKLSNENDLLSGKAYDFSGISEVYFNMADDSSYLSKAGEGESKYSLLQKSKVYADSSIEILQQIGELDQLAKMIGQLSKTQAMLGNFKDAYSNAVQFKELNDSIFNIENNKKLTKTAMQYEFEKKEAATKAEQEKRDIRQRNIRNSIAVGLAGALVFLLVVYRQRNKIAKEKKRSEELLLNILPSETAEELKKNGTTKAKDFEEVTVLFTDFKHFTMMSEQLTAQELVNEINFCYSNFDHIITKYGIEKIKTIGDSYMCAGGLPVANSNHAENTVRAALEIRDFIEKEKQKRQAENKPFFEIRIGCNTGPVVAGIVGIKKFAYDIWGDTVNIASRMESSGQPGKVNISGSTYQLVKDKFNCEYRGKIEAKNKGVIDMYFVEKA